MNVLPISQTNIDWATYLVATKNALGRSVTSYIDEKGIKTNNLFSYLLTISEFYESHDIDNSILRHGSFGFLVECDNETLLELMENTDLSINSISLYRDTRLLVVTGTLLEWRDSVINCCSIIVSPELRALSDMFLLHLEKAGLSQLWQKYKKEIIKDKTFVLEAK